MEKFEAEFLRRMQTLGRRVVSVRGREYRSPIGHQGPEIVPDDLAHLLRRKTGAIRIKLSQNFCGCQLFSLLWTRLDEEIVYGESLRAYSAKTYVAERKSIAGVFEDREVFGFSCSSRS
jgi:hypothetical protein